MDAACRDFVERSIANLSTRPKYILEIGSRNINGGLRDLFPEAIYVGIDLLGGTGVDIVADGATYQPKMRPDLVLCCNVFEHAPKWREVIMNFQNILSQNGGTFIITAATDPWPAHSAYDGAELRENEYYQNVPMNELIIALQGWLIRLVKKDDVGHLFAVALVESNYAS